MKHLKTLLLTGLMILSLQAWAQPEQGMIMVGGNIGFDSYSFNEFTSTTLYVTPLAGFMVTDNLMVGASLGLVLYGGDDSGSSIGIGPFVRYYLPGENSARFFGQAGIDYSSFDPGDNFDATSSFGFNLGVGMDYFINKHVAFEAILGFSSDKDDDDDESATSFGLNIGVAAFIGGGGGE